MVHDGRGEDHGFELLHRRVDLGLAFLVMLLDEPGRKLALDKGGMVENGIRKIHIGCHALDMVSIQGIDQGGRASSASHPSDHFGEKRVVIHAYETAGLDPLSSLTFLP